MRSRTFNERNVLTGTIVVLVLLSVMPAGTSRFFATIPAATLMLFVNPFLDMLNVATGELRESPEPKEIVEGLSVEQLQDNLLVSDAINQALLIRITELQRELAAYRQYEQITQTNQIEQATPILARVTRSLPHQLTINQGSTRHIKEGHVVIDGVNLVGLVALARPTHATIELITAPGRILDVRIVPPPQHRLDRGEVVARLQLTATDAGDAFTAQCRNNDPIEVGDIAVLDDYRWPPLANGFYVGLVTAIVEDPSDPYNFSLARIEPVRSLQHLNQVVIRLPQTE